VKGQAPEDHYPWPGKKGFWSSPFQQAVTWLVGHLWWVVGGFAVVLALAFLFMGPGSWDLLAGLIFLLLAGFSFFRRGLRRLPLAVLLAAVAVALFTVGGRAMLARHAAVVQSPPPPGSAQTVLPTQQNGSVSPGTQQNSAVSTLTWQKTVSLAESPLGLGQGASGRMWVFESQRPVLSVDKLALLDEATGSTVFSQGLGTTATAFTVDSDGNAWVAEDQNGQPVLLKYDSSSFKATSYSLPGSVTKVVGLADTSEGIWLVVQGPGPGLSATRFEPITNTFTPFVDLTPSAGPVQVAGTPAGRLWVVLEQSNQLVSVGNSGVLHNYAAWPGKLGQVVAANGENCYVTGYAPQTANHVHVLYYEYGRSAYVDDYPIAGADMPGGVTWSPNTGTVFAGYAMVGGGHGLPGVWEHRLFSSVSVSVPLNGLPGGGTGPLLPAGNGVWLGVPFSRALILMGPA